MPSPRELLRQRLDRQPLLLDGGMGSLLIAAGLDAGRSPESWVLEHPDRIVDAHRRYVEAGAAAIQTVTFGGTAPKLASAGLPGRMREINEAAVRLARQAVQSTDVLVSGDLGPTGKFPPPMGDTTEAWLEEAYCEQVAVLAEAGVDLLCLETMYDLREALAAVRAARQTDLPVLASMTFEIRPRGVFTIMGDRLLPSLEALAEAGADVVGFNCSAIASEMVGMVEAAATCSAPLMAQPNAGQPRATLGGVVYDADIGEFVTDLMRMVTAGARVVGGCCGTDPDFIAAARRAMDDLA